MSEYNTDEQNEKARNFRFINYNEILKEQFHLAYFGHIEYLASEDMVVLERHALYHILVEQKKEEKKAHEEAMKKARENRGKRSWRRRR